PTEGSVLAIQPHKLHHPFPRLTRTNGLRSGIGLDHAVAGPQTIRAGQAGERVMQFMGLDR
ncbi:amino acid ABC transporter permease/ATP-binding protein, partial [Pseudomonas quasicaspiana]|nr:amino acid ABC transporter permease/ATP-binding protein [Pseudomonas quasicaspiana]